MLKRMRWAALLLGAGLGVAGCADQYGYGGVSAGYGYADGYYDGYGYGDPYGYGYGGYGYPSYFGWYGNYYYPGTGVYVYDRNRRPYRWNDGQRRYWEGRRNNWRGDRGSLSDNWNGFDRRRDGRGLGNGYPGRGALGAGTVRPDGVGRYGGNPTYRRDGNAAAPATGGEARSFGDGNRGFGGRWRDRPAGAPSVSTPQAVSPPAATGGARSWGGTRGGWGGRGSGGGRGGRGRN